jgi:hypothetical protein
VSRLPATLWTVARSPLFPLLLCLEAVILYRAASGSVAGGIVAGISLGPLLVLSRKGIRFLDRTASHRERREFLFVLGLGLLAGVRLIAGTLDRAEWERQVCSGNRRAIQEAKGAWAMAYGMHGDSVPAWGDLVRPGERGFLQATVTCPSGGEYNLGEVQEHPRCSYHDQNE